MWAICVPTPNPPYPNPIRDRERKSSPISAGTEPRVGAIILTCLLNIAISSLNDSDEQTSPPCTPGSLGVHVANSHFSKISAKSGNSGCLEGTTKWHSQYTYNIHQ